MSNMRHIPVDTNEISFSYSYNWENIGHNISYIYIYIQRSGDRFDYLTSKRKVHNIMKQWKFSCNCYIVGLPNEESSQEYISIRISTAFTDIKDGM